jgi:prepilin-type N-terminal cleavage/methylation domain-containing protein
MTRPTRSSPNARLRHSRGFTLLELSIVVVIIGVLVAATLKSADVMRSTKDQQMILQIKQVESAISEYRRAKQRLPGDCDGDGLINTKLQDLVTGGATGLAVNDKALRATRYDFISGMPAEGCVAADFNNPFNQLKTYGLLTTSVSNRIAATHSAGDFFVISTVQLSGAASSEQSFNAIVMFNIPVSLARKLAAAYDGSAGDSACAGRVRRMTADALGFESKWLNNTGVTTENSDTLVIVAYFFDPVARPQSC